MAKIIEEQVEFDPSRHQILTEVRPGETMEQAIARHHGASTDRRARGAEMRVPWRGEYTPYLGVIRDWVSNLPSWGQRAQAVRDLLADPDLKKKKGWAILTMFMAKAHPGRFFNPRLPWEFPPNVAAIWQDMGITDDPRLQRLLDLLGNNQPEVAEAEGFHLFLERRPDFTFPRSDKWEKKITWQEAEQAILASGIAVDHQYTVNPSAHRWIGNDRLAVPQLADIEQLLHVTTVDQVQYETVEIDGQLYVVFDCSNYATAMMGEIAALGSATAGQLRVFFQYVDGGGTFAGHDLNFALVDKGGQVVMVVIEPQNDGISPVDREYITAGGKKYIYRMSDWRMV